MISICKYRMKPVQVHSTVWLSVYGSYYCSDNIRMKYACVGLHPTVWNEKSGGKGHKLWTWGAVVAKKDSGWWRRCRVSTDMSNKCNGTQSVQYDQLRIVPDSRGKCTKNSIMGHKDLYASIGKGYLRNVSTRLLILRGRRKDFEPSLKENTIIWAMDGSDGVGAPLLMVGREESNRSGPAGGVECRRE